MAPRGLLLALVLLWAPLPSAALSVLEIGADGAPGEDGETVSAQGIESVAGANPVEVKVTAQGGRGGPATPDGAAAGDGGGAGLGEVFGASQTGEVSVVGRAIGGQGGAGAGLAPAGRGAPVQLWNAVDGETRGALSLQQVANGGYAGGGRGGGGGGATSVLRRRKSASSFSLASAAYAGGPHELRSHGPLGGAGAPAAATGIATNETGAVETAALSLAGRGGVPDPGAPGARGGDARALAIGDSFGNGNPVRVGNLPIPPLPPAYDQGPFPFPLLTLFFPGAYAGNGGGFELYVDAETPRGGQGGDATSLSIGVAQGDSPVEVVDRARGGAGGSQNGVAEDLPSRGGRARSVAIGQGHGASPVQVHADALGGSAGTVRSFASLVPLAADVTAARSETPEGVAGGDAEAWSFASGRGEVTARAEAQGGSGTRHLLPVLGLDRPPHPGAEALALASALGTSGEARASASTNGPTLQVEARAISSLRRAATAAAHVGPADRASADGEIWGLRRRDVFAEATVAPDAAAVEEALASAPGLAEALEDAGAEEIAALGSLRASPPGAFRGRAVTTSTLEIEFQRLRPASGPAQETFVALFAPRLPRRGLVSLRVRLTKEDEVLVDELFDHPLEAAGFLDGALLEVGPMGWLPVPPFDPRPEVATLSLELRSRAGLEVGCLLATVPLPTP